MMQLSSKCNICNTWMSALPDIIFTPEYLISKLIYLYARECAHRHCACISGNAGIHELQIIYYTSDFQCHKGLLQFLKLKLLIQ